jgi:hypothetical protein
MAEGILDPSFYGVRFLNNIFPVGLLSDQIALIRQKLRENGGRHEYDKAGY